MSWKWTVANRSCWYLQQIRLDRTSLGLQRLVGSSVWDIKPEAYLTTTIMQRSRSLLCTVGTTMTHVAKQRQNKAMVHEWASTEEGHYLGVWPYSTLCSETYITVPESRSAAGTSSFMLSETHTAGRMKLSIETTSLTQTCCDQTFTSLLHCLVKWCFPDAHVFYSCNTNHSAKQCCPLQVFVNCSLCLPVCPCLPNDH